MENKLFYVVVLGVLVSASVFDAVASDKRTRVIRDEADAKGICSAVCSNYGGWNGQWANEYGRNLRPEGGLCGCNN